MLSGLCLFPLCKVLFKSDVIPTGSRKNPYLWGGYSPALQVVNDINPLNRLRAKAIITPWQRCFRLNSRGRY